MAYDVLIRRGSLVLPTKVVRGDVAIEGGLFAAIAPELAGPASEEIDAAGLHLFPGVVDPHVHFNEPGRTEWEGAATGSAALAAGGGTCFCDMPLNSSPPTLDGPSFDQKAAALAANSRTDFGLWGGLTPTNLDRLDELAERGVIGFKAFMCASGIDDFTAADDYTLWQGMQIAARLKLPVAVHAENETLTRVLARQAIAAGKTGVRDFLASRPVVAELEAIQRAILLADEAGCSLHIVHVSCGRGVALVAEAQANGIDVTCETCPHYLVLTEDDRERLGAIAKCAPPLRSAEDQAQLWRALLAGKIAFVASDHSPAPASMKLAADFFQIWGGISGVQMTLSLLLAAGHEQRGLTLSYLAKLTSRAAAERFRLAGKGCLEVGADADLALVDLSAAGPLEQNELRDRHRLSPYVGYPLRGRVQRTLVRGQTVFHAGRLAGSPTGRLVTPNARP
ncbi:MAG: allantoinase AllB [Pirellulaceae bacterium]|nr:allantoinase AllB [Pirellulaceae bacterium]